MILLNTVRKNWFEVLSFLRKHKIAFSIFVFVHRLFDFLRGRGVGIKVQKAIDIFLPQEPQKFIRKIKWQLWKYYDLYMIEPIEYFLYNFQNLTEQEKAEFVGDKERSVLCRRLSSDETRNIFHNKWLTYNTFKKYYKREIIHITKEEDINLFIDFVNKHKKVIVKRSDLAQGESVFLTDNSNDGIENAVKELKAMLSIGKDAVVEELIVQSSAFAQFNASSVNTIRFATFRTDSAVVNMFAELRMGRTGSVVDNAGAGGVIANIDLQTGIINTDGVDKHGASFVTHPDTHLQFKGFQIPEWNQLLNLVKELSAVVPEQRYVGWDLALTDKGWVMVEGNAFAQFEGPQLTTRKGMRTLVENTFYKYI